MSYATKEQVYLRGRSEESVHAVGLLFLNGKSCLPEKIIDGLSLFRFGSCSMEQSN